jgi:hypothetical protein
MRFKMNVAKYIVAIFTIVGISGLLYTSSFLPSVFAQGSAGNNTGSQQQGIGTFEELQNLTQGNQQLLANNTSISNSSLSSGMELEQDTDQPNATAAANETDQQQLQHTPQSQVGPAIDPSAGPESQQNQTSQGQQQNQTSQGQQQNQTSQGQQQPQQNQTGGPLDQLMKLFGGGQ